MFTLVVILRSLHGLIIGTLALGGRDPTEMLLFSLPEQLLLAAQMGSWGIFVIALTGDILKFFPERQI